MTDLSADQIRARVAELGQWFHNMDLNGVQTAPDHFLHCLLYTSPSPRDS